MTVTEKIINIVKAADVSFENAEVEMIRRHGPYTSVFFSNGSFNIIADKVGDEIRVYVMAANEKKPTNEVDWWQQRIVCNDVVKFA